MGGNRNNDDDFFTKNALIFINIISDIRSVLVSPSLVKFLAEKGITFTIIRTKLKKDKGIFRHNVRIIIKPIH